VNTRAGNGVARLASADLLDETGCGENGGPGDHRLVDRHRLRQRLTSLADRSSPSGGITSCPSGLRPSTTRCCVLDASNRGAHQDHGRGSPERLRGRDYLLPLLDWRLSPTPLRLGDPSHQRRRRSHRLSGETGQRACGRDREPCRALALRGSLLPPRTRPNASERTAPDLRLLAGSGPPRRGHLLVTFPNAGSGDGAARRFRADAADPRRFTA